MVNFAGFFLALLLLTGVTQVDAVADYADVLDNFVEGASWFIGGPIVGWLITGFATSPPLGCDVDKDFFVLEENCMLEECERMDSCLIEKHDCNDNNPAVTYQNPCENCGDGKDNNADGKVDCDDPFCVEDPFCVSEDCSNDVDDDGDDDIDCADSDCSSKSPCSFGCDADSDSHPTPDECAMDSCSGLAAGAWCTGDKEGWECLNPDSSNDPLWWSCEFWISCTDGINNDMDPHIDCEDIGCEPHYACGGTETDCSNEWDDDRDGVIDCDDNDCADSCGEICDNGLDDDRDGVIDCDDNDCDSHENCIDPLEDCEDGVDNDGDLQIDCSDFDCIDDPACIDDPVVEICTGDEDEDEDGLVDCQDTVDCCGDIACFGNPVCGDEGDFEDCVTIIDDDEDGLLNCDDSDCDTDENCHELNCEDGLDGLDPDSDIDCDDSDCEFAAVCAEDCGDGVDNDDDGATDCDDPFCEGNAFCSNSEEGEGSGEGDSGDDKPWWDFLSEDDESSEDSGEEPLTSPEDDSGSNLESGRAGPDGEFTKNFYFIAMAIWILILIALYFVWSYFRRRAAKNNLGKAIKA